ncbi:MAG: response regulator transcription factor [Rhodanobacter sp.]
MHASKRTLNVLLVEDDTDVAAGIGDYLGAHDLAVDFAYTAAQARARLRERTFDVVILDVNLPDQDGLTLFRWLKSEGGLRSPVLFLTARGALDDKLHAFALGAVDYMVKPFAPAELVARVRAIVAHVTAGGGAQLQVGGYILDLHGYRLQRDGAGVALHAAGFTLLRRLMEASPACVSRDELCTLLWDGQPPDSNPLRMHVYQLRQAFLRQFGQPLIKTMRGVGYCFVGEADAAP